MIEDAQNALDAAIVAVRLEPHCPGNVETVEYNRHLLSAYRQLLVRANQWVRFNPDDLYASMAEGK